MSRISLVECMHIQRIPCTLVSGGRMKEPFNAYFCICAIAAANSSRRDYLDWAHTLGSNMIFRKYNIAVAPKEPL